MKNIKLHIFKKIFSLITASSMLLSCGYVSAMESESEEFDYENNYVYSDLLSSSLSLEEARDYCLSFLKQNRSSYNSIANFVANLDKCLKKLRILTLALEFTTFTKMKVKSCEIDGFGCKTASTLTKEITDSLQLLRSNALSVTRVYDSIVENSKDLIKDISKKSNNSYSVLPLIATTRCTTYSIAYNNFIESVSKFTSNIEKIDEIANIKRLSLEANSCIKNLQEFIDNNTHLLNQLKEFSK